MERGKGKVKGEEHEEEKGRRRQREEGTGEKEKGESEEGVEGMQEKEILIASPRVPTAFLPCPTCFACASHLVIVTMTLGNGRA